MRPILRTLSRVSSGAIADACSFKRRSLTRIGLVAGMALLAGQLPAQTPVVLPNTVSSVAGNVPTATTTGAPCPTNPQYTATDALGNGCPAVNAVFAGNERSMTVDPEGNIYVIADTSNPQDVRRIDARSGIITIFAGNGSGGCGAAGVTVDGTLYTAVDKVGDGCPVAITGGFNGARGLGSDPYGNIIIPVVGDYAVHFVCTTVSPLCSPAQVNVKLMRAVAGCTTSVTGYGTGVTGTTVGSAGDGTLATQTSGTCTVGVYQPRQAAGDKWDNIYFTDNGNNRIRVVLGVPSITVNGVTLANPLYAAEALWTSTGSYAAPTQGFIYPIAGGGTACAAKTDAGGDGCPFYQTVVNTSTYVQGIAVDADGDFLFVDGLGRLRTIYMGGTAIRNALLANGVASPVVGTSYALLGNGTNFLYYNSALSGTYLGSSVSLQPNAVQRLAVDAAGNIYIGDQAQVLFYDIYTGSVRRLGGGTTTTSCNASAIGDGCPIAQALFGAANSVLSVSLDNLGNLYLQDLQNKLVRRASALTLPTEPVNSSLSTSVVVHAPAAGSTVTVAAGNTPDYTVGAASCATANSDNSVDCAAPVTYAPKEVALRTDPFSYTTTVAAVPTTVNRFLDANATGSALVFDTAGTPSTTVLSPALTGNTVVVEDGAGFSYVSGAQGINRTNGTTVTSVSATPATYIAVDAQSNVYATNGSSTTITKYIYAASTGTYSASTLTLPLVPINGAATQAYSGPLAVDPNGYLYIADQVNKQLLRIAPDMSTGQQITQTAFTSPSALTQDSYGNLLVLDAASLLKIPASGFLVNTASPVANPVVTFPTPLVAPTAVAADQGENIYVADSGKIVALSLSGYQYTIPGVSGTGVAVDGSGNLYTVAPAVAGITEVLRSSESHAFGTDVSTPYVGVFGNAGATAATGFAQSDTGGNFTNLAPATPVAASAPTCNLSSTALAGGAICNASLTFSPTATGSGTVTDVITFVPAPATIGALTLTGVKNGSTATTTTAIAGNTTGLVYTTSTQTTFTVTVTQSTGQPAGVVSFSIDGGPSTSYPLTAATASTATATVPVSGLTAGPHSVVATYGGSAGIAGSTSTPVTFNIAQASTTLKWTPANTTVQYSTALGAGVLDAVASSSGATVPGVYVYTAQQGSGPAVEINSASFLPIGTYALTVTFYPNDMVDYTGSTASVASFTVTKASTTAGLGATQMLVAADGSGNFTSVQSAVNALPATGGSIYIAPGTYPGDVTVVQPNVSMRGLGGDPTKVVITHAGGAFGGSGFYAYAGEFTAAQNNGSQLPSGSTVFTGDEGSATMVVAKGVNTAVGTTTLNPNNFYAEGFTLNNTYDTDTTTTTTTYAASSNGNCTANAGPARTYNDLFNNSLLCASQALAIWITSDLAVMNNVYTGSLQDTIYAGSQGASGTSYVPARQLWFRGKVTGTVDYIFGDAAAVFDHSNIYTLPHGTSVSGTATIEAQNKANQTGSSGDYLSGYIMSSDTFTSYTTGMSGLEFGRPYGPYSTWIMLNDYIDQVNPSGYIEFSGDTNLPTSTYAEYNDILYTDPTPNTPDLNGVIYTGLGGNSGAGVTGTRETTSLDPGTPEAANAIKTSLTQPQAQQYYENNFLGMTVSNSSTGVTNWVPTTALAGYANSFATAATTNSVNVGSSVTLLMRPQTPGLGAFTYPPGASTPTTFTIPSGTYTLTDTYNGTSTTLASGTLDAAGEAYFTTKNLGAGTHSLTWTYSGDANFSASTSTAYVLTVNGAVTTTVISTTATNATITYGQSAPLTVTVSTASGTPTGTVTLSIDGTSTQTATLSAGVAQFSITGLAPGPHTFTASYGGSSTLAPSSTSSSFTLTVIPATAVATVTPVSIAYGTASATLTATFAYSGPVAPTGAVTFTVNGTAITATCTSAAGVRTCTATDTATTSLAPGTYPIAVSQAADTNYTAASASGTLTVTAATATATATPVSIAYGTSSAKLTATFSFTASTAPTGAVSFTVNGATFPATCTTTGTVRTCTATDTATGSLAVNTYPITVTEAADTGYSAASATSTLTVTAAAPTVAVGAASIIYNSASATLTATIAFSGSVAPTGAVTFTVNGTNLNATCTAAAGTRTCTASLTAASTLAAGTYTVTVSEAADANYAAASGTGTFTVAPAPDFGFATQGTTYQSILPGASATFTFALSPLYPSYPGWVTFSVTGLPPGATYTLMPASIAANAPAQTVTLTVQTAGLHADASHGLHRGGELAALAGLLLPLCLRRRMRGKLGAKLAVMLLIFGSLAGMGTMIGCGSRNGFLAQAPANYNIVVTATSGTVQHTATVTLNVQ